MSAEKKIAYCNWIAGMAIGLMPLLAHVLLYVAAKPQQGWTDNWSPDLLFITISNSGLAALSVFVKMATGDQRIRNSPARLIVVWVLLLLCFAFSSMLYGATVSGQGNDSTWITAIVLMILAAVCSLNFELALADVNGKE
jgi:hypothetical protein